METLWDFLTYTKAVSYLVAFSLTLCFIPFYLFLVDREEKDE